MTYTITRRVYIAGGLFTAVACAVPDDKGCLALVRTRDCDSQLDADSLMHAMAQALASELLARGDRVHAQTHLH